MFDWVKRKMKSPKMPHYSALLKQPSRQLPSELVEQEKSEEHRARHDEIERSMERPPADTPLFVEIVAPDQQGLLTIQMPEDGAHCLPVFSTSFRAGDYVRTLIDRGSSVQYLASNPLELVTLLREAQDFGIRQFALDRCPRCNVYCSIQSAGIKTTDDAINCWVISKAAQFARMELYLTYAQTSARAGDLYSALDVLLETAGHVSCEEPRVHLGLGEVAVALYDADLFREAKAFLQFFQLNTWELRLDAIARANSPRFEFID